MPRLLIQMRQLVWGSIAALYERYQYSKGQCFDSKLYLHGIFPLIFLWWWTQIHINNLRLHRGSCNEVKTFWTRTLLYSIYISKPGHHLEEQAEGQTRHKGAAHSPPIWLTPCLTYTHLWILFDGYAVMPWTSLAVVRLFLFCPLSLL